MVSGINVQDTLKPAFVIRINTDNLIPDSVFEKIVIREDTAPPAKLVRKEKEISPDARFLSDTTFLAFRNNISDVTFYDSTNFIRALDFKSLKIVPRGFPEIAEARRDSVTISTTNKTEGWPIPENAIRNDWLTIFTITAILLYVLVKKAAKPVLREAGRFFLMRGIAEHSTYSKGSLFYRESTILNFISFWIISLFIFCSASSSDLIPGGMPAPSFIALSFLGIAAALMARHITCSATGILSGRTDVFNEYLASVYLTYRFLALPAFFFVVIMAYTPLPKPEFMVYAGAILFFIVYLYRIIRLFLIFIKRNVSIFYFILYLCALEILPALIIVKLAAGSF
ncbi:MAG: DUF4271 domain-containing protein [Bacteroidales bacterium]|jgi:hypothetical protein|nr:DUF4271 domain-containing protein [Bacteroidales bacterium]